jgi:hypothetical protein
VKAKWISPLTVGLVGFVCLLGRFIWSWLDSRAWHRSEQEMGWILDRFPPKGIGSLARYGIALILAALVWVCVRMLSHRLALRAKK